MPQAVTAVDDSYHPPASPHPLWTETSMYSFDIPEEGISAVIYPYIRPNMGIATLNVYVWDRFGTEPRHALYGKSRWHLPIPSTDLTNLELDGLVYRTVEPMRVFDVRYRDGDALNLDLRYEALMEPHVEFNERGRGHIDQPCRVTGDVAVRGRKFHLDGLAMRDRSWVKRPDDISLQMGYSFGIRSEKESWLLVTGYGEDGNRFRGGYLVRDGVYQRLAAGSRQVERRNHYPVALTVEIADEAGRTLVAHGTTENRLAYQATSGIFAWMSLTRWETEEAVYFGEDQDTWTYDLLNAQERADSETGE